MSAEEYTHVCTLQLTTKDDENLELDFKTEETAVALAEYLKLNPPINLESLAVVKNIYQVDHWEHEAGDDRKG